MKPQRKLKAEKKSKGVRWNVDTICPIGVVEKAWSKVLGGRKVNSPADFVELCKTLNND